MRKFDEQFMTRFMLPLVGEIVADMQKGEKNPFLNKLLRGEKLEDMDRREFIRYYFETRQDLERKRPFADMDEASCKAFWEKFLDRFGNYMILRYRLSGEDGAHAAFAYDKDKGAFNEEATRNIFYLGFRIAQDFENDRITELAKSDEKTRKALEDGKILKLVVENGAEKAVTREEADPEMASDFTAAASADEEKKYEDIVTKLAESGLKPVPDSFKDRLGQWTFSLEPGRESRLTGEVEDLSGNRLKVSVNSDAGADDQKKYEFSFMPGAVSPDGKSLAGYPPFSVSESDLAKFREKGAFDIAQGVVPKPVRDKYALPAAVGVPGMGTGVGGVGLAGPLELEARGGLPEEMPIGVKGKMPITLKGSRRKRITRLTEEGVSIPAGAKPRAPMPQAKREKPAKVQARKEQEAKLERQRRAAAVGPQVPGMAQQPGETGEEAAAPQPKKKPFWTPPKILATTYGVAFGSAAGSIGAMLGFGPRNVPNPNEVAAAINMVLHELGIKLFS